MHTSLILIDRKTMTLKDLFFQVKGDLARGDISRALKDSSDAYKLSIISIFIGVSLYVFAAICKLLMKLFGINIY